MSLNVSFKYQGQWVHHFPGVLAENMKQLSEAIASEGEEWERPDRQGRSTLVSGRVCPGTRAHVLAECRLCLPGAWAVGVVAVPLLVLPAWDVDGPQ